MDFNFIKSSIVSTLLFSGIISIATIPFFSFDFPMGIFAGAIWGCLNVFFLYQLLYEILITRVKSIFKILMLVVLKFPLLYGIGFLLLQSNKFSILSLSIGLFLAIGIFFFKSYKQGIALT